MFKVALCDDNEYELENLNQMIQNYKTRSAAIDIQIDKFSSVTELIRKLKTGYYYDIFLLDVIMPEMTGIDLARHIRSYTYQSVIIFVTSSKDFALDAYSVDAIQYLLKPIAPAALFSAFDKAYMLSKIQNAKSIAVNTKNGVENIYYHNIIFLECRSHCVYFYLVDGSIIHTKTLRQSFTDYTAPFLMDNRFLRSHQSFVLNTQHIVKLKSKEIEMTNGILIPIAKNKLHEVKNKYMNYIDSLLPDFRFP